VRFYGQNLLVRLNGKF